MYALIAYYSDGCTYSADHLIATFDNKDVAELVCEELCKAAGKEKNSQRSLHRNFPDENGGFRVDIIDHYSVESESRIAGIVKIIIKKNFKAE